MRVRSKQALLGVSLAVGGMGALCFGFKRSALALFAAGVRELERDWRNRHPEFHGTLAERWQLSLEFYRETHQNATNRTLHIVGIPLIVGGAAGLLLSRPLSPVSGGIWLGSLAAFSGGWALNILGHAAYEGRAPAFSEDGLSFLAGPVWDLQQLLQR
jgi:hypothetical protein